MLWRVRAAEACMHAVPVHPGRFRSEVECCVHDCILISSNDPVLTGRCVPISKLIHYELV